LCQSLPVERGQIMHNRRDADTAARSRVASRYSEGRSITHTNPSTSSHDGDFPLIRHDDRRRCAEKLERRKLHRLRAGGAG
jgi:hypothetical protein